MGGALFLPLFDSFDELASVLPAKTQPQEAEPFVHVLTHKDLHLHPVRVAVPANWAAPEGEWFAAARVPSLGLPSPIRKLLAA